MREEEAEEGIGIGAGLSRPLLFVLLFVSDFVSFFPETPSPSFPFSPDFGNPTIDFPFSPIGVTPEAFLACFLEREDDVEALPFA